MGCVGFRPFFPLSPRLICRSSSHFFFCLTLTPSFSLTALSRLSLLSLAITASLFYSRHHTPRPPSRVLTHLCQNLFNFNSSGNHSSPKKHGLALFSLQHSPFSTKITSRTLPISNTTCPAKHLHMIRTSSASMRTSNIDLHLCTNY